MRRIAPAAAALCLLAASACSGPEVPDTARGARCTSDEQCDPGEDCALGHCKAAGGAPDGGSDAGQPAGRLTLSPASATLTVQATRPAPAQELALANTGDALLHWTLGCTGSAVPSPASGTLAAGASTTAQIALPVWTAPGSQSLGCTAATADGLGGPLTWTLAATVTAAPVGVLTLAPASASLTAQAGVQAAAQDVSVGNSGDGPLTWAIACTGGAAPSPAGGTLAAGASAAVKVTLPVWGSAGSQALDCTATTSDGTGGPRTWSLAATVQAAPIGQLTLAPTGASVTVQAGAQAPAQDLTVGNSGTAALHWAIACTGGASAAPASGTLAAGATTPVKVTLPLWSAPGTPSLTCSASTSDGSGGPRAWTLSATVTQGQLTLAPATATTSVQVGAQAAALDATVGNSGTAALHWSLSCTGGASPAPASGLLAAGTSAPVKVTPPVWSSAGTQTVTCTATTSDGGGGPRTWTLTATVNAAPTGVGTSGGTVDLLDAVFTGDTRPANCDTGVAGNYPITSFKQIVQSMTALQAQFAFDLGDHMYVCDTTPNPGPAAVAQMGFYTDTIATAGWPAGKPWFMTLGNHDCGRAYTNPSNPTCVGYESDPNFAAYAPALQRLSGQGTPNYKVDVQTRKGLVRFVFLADNYSGAAQQAWVESTLAEADQIAAATIISRHYPVTNTGRGTGPSWSYQAATGHKATLLLTAHAHSYSHDSVAWGGRSMICGLGAATDYASTTGFCRLQQQADGSFKVTRYDKMGLPSDTWSVAPQ